MEPPPPHGPKIKLKTATTMSSRSKTNVNMASPPAHGPMENIAMVVAAILRPVENLDVVPSPPRGGWRTSTQHLLDLQVGGDPPDGGWRPSRWRVETLKMAAAGRPAPAAPPDHAELEVVVAAALDDGGVAHLHCRRVRPRQELLLLDGLLHRLGQLAVAHLLQRGRGARGANPSARQRQEEGKSGENRRETEQNRKTREKLKENGKIGENWKNKKKLNKN